MADGCSKIHDQALLLSSTFGDMKNPWVIASVIMASIITLLQVFVLLIKKERRIKMGAIVVSVFVTLVAGGVSYTFIIRTRKESVKRKIIISKKRAQLTEPAFYCVCLF